MARISGIIVRPERSGDEAAISSLNERAFGGLAEAAIIRGLRAGGGLTLSLITELDGHIVGHILFSPACMYAMHGPRSFAVRPVMAAWAGDEGPLSAKSVAPPRTAAAGS